jgi:hypothetical protein
MNTETTTYTTIYRIYNTKTGMPVKEFASLALAQQLCADRNENAGWTQFKVITQYLPI